MTTLFCLDFRSDGTGFGMAQFLVDPWIAENAFVQLSTAGQRDADFSKAVHDIIHHAMLNNREMDWNLMLLINQSESGQNGPVSLVALLRQVQRCLIDRLSEVMGLRPNQIQVVLLDGLSRNGEGAPIDEANRRVWEMDMYGLQDARSGSDRVLMRFNREDIDTIVSGWKEPVTGNARTDSKVGELKGQAKTAITKDFKALREDIDAVFADVKKRQMQNSELPLEDGDDLAHIPASFRLEHEDRVAEILASSEYQREKKLLEKLKTDVDSFLDQIDDWTIGVLHSFSLEEFFLEHLKRVYSLTAITDITVNVYRFALEGRSHEDYQHALLNVVHLVGYLISGEDATRMRGVEARDVKVERDDCYLLEMLEHFSGWLTNAETQIPRHEAVKEMKLELQKAESWEGQMHQPPRLSPIPRFASVIRNDKVAQEWSAWLNETDEKIQQYEQDLQKQVDDEMETLRNDLDTPILDDIDAAMNLAELEAKRKETERNYHGHLSELSRSLEQVRIAEEWPVIRDGMERRIGIWVKATLSKNGIYSAAIVALTVVVLPSILNGVYLLQHPQLQVQDKDLAHLIYLAGIFLLGIFGVWLGFKTHRTYVEKQFGRNRIHVDQHVQQLKAKAEHWSNFATSLGRARIENENMTYLEKRIAGCARRNDEYKSISKRICTYKSHAKQLLNVIKQRTNGSASVSHQPLTPCHAGEDVRKLENALSPYGHIVRPEKQPMIEGTSQERFELKFPLGAFKIVIHRDRAYEIKE